MRLIDLTRPLDATDIDRVPARVRNAAVNLVPAIEHVTPQGEGADVMCSIFACERTDLPDGEGWGDERLLISTHLGTHVDAPLHYGSRCEGKPARTVGDIAIEELFVPGVVLDLRSSARPEESISVDALADALRRNGAEVPEGGAVLIRTGQERYTVADEECYRYPGMSRAGTLFLAEHGAKILGTDALGWDRPFYVMRRAFQESRDPSQIWDGHFAGRDREVFIVQQLHNLAALPPSGFTLGCFPLRLNHCSASPARVIAFLGE